MNIIEQINNNRILKIGFATTSGICLILLISNLLLSFYLFRVDSKTILLPSQATKEFYVTEKSVSEEYLELHARDIANTILNLNLNNYQYSADSILKITHPAYYPKIKQELAELSIDIKERNVSLHFMINSMNIKPSKLIADVSGVLKTKVGTETVKETQKTYRIVFDYSYSFLSLIEFYEVGDND